MLWQENQQTYRPDSTIEIVLLRIFFSAVYAASFAIAFFESIIREYGFESAEGSLMGFLFAIMIGMIVGSVVVEIILLLVEYFAGEAYENMNWIAKMIWDIVIEILRYAIAALITYYIMCSGSSSAGTAVADQVRGIIKNEMEKMVFRIIPRMFRNLIESFFIGIFGQLTRMIPPVPVSGNLNDICQYRAINQGDKGSGVIYSEGKISRNEMIKWVPRVLARYFQTSGLYIFLAPADGNVTVAIQRINELVLRMSVYILGTPDLYSRWFTQLCGMLHVMCDGYDILYSDIPIDRAILSAKVFKKYNIPPLTQNEVFLYESLALAENGPDIVAQKGIFVNGEFDSWKYAIVECKGHKNLGTWNLNDIYKEMRTSGPDPEDPKRTLKKTWCWQGGRRWLKSPSVQVRYIATYALYYWSAWLAVTSIVELGAAYDLYYVIGSTNGKMNMNYRYSGSRSPIPLDLNIMVNSGYESKGALNGGSITISQYYLV